MPLVPCLSLMLAACVDPFPSMPEQDFDGDGVTTTQGDCDDFDADTHPGADECGLVLEEPTDHDCDGFVDGGILPWVDDFEDGVIEGWVSGRQTMSGLQERGGALEQVEPNALEVYHSDGAECWQDLVVEYTLRPAAVVPELFCNLRVRTRGYGEHWEDVPPSSYQFFLHHHSTDFAGLSGSDWDGWQPNNLERLHEGTGTVLAGEKGEVPYSSRPDFEHDEDYLPYAERYTIRIEVWETDEGTMLDCRYGLDEAEPSVPCIGSAEWPLLDPEPDRPLTGGVGLGCAWQNYDMDSGEGIALEHIEIQELGE